MTRDELLRKWVEALDSGRYTQGKDALRSYDTYCCLGVLCDLTGPECWREMTNIPGGYTYTNDTYKWGQTAVLPLNLMLRIGLSGDQQCELTSANDAGETFTEIAQRIRKMFPDVFTESVV